MNNKQLIDHLAKKLGRQRDDVKNLLGAFSGIVAGCCAAGDSVAVPGFGDFVAEKREQRVERDAHTGARVLFPPAVELTFHTSAVFRSKLKNRRDEQPKPSLDEDYISQLRAQIKQEVLAELKDEQEGKEVSDER